MEQPASVFNVKMEQLLNQYSGVTNMYNSPESCFLIVGGKSIEGCQINQTNAGFGISYFLKLYKMIRLSDCNSKIEW